MPISAISCVVLLCHFQELQPVSEGYRLWNKLCSVARDSRSQWPRGLRHELSSPIRTLGIVGSNPTRGMYVCVLLFSVCVVLCEGSGLATG
jgi:hypothetical protein